MLDDRPFGYRYGDCSWSLSLLAKANGCTGVDHRVVGQEVLAPRAFMVTEELAVRDGDIHPQRIVPFSHLSLRMEKRHVRRAERQAALSERLDHKAMESLSVTQCLHPSWRARTCRAWLSARGSQSHDGNPPIGSSLSWHGLPWMLQVNVALAC